MQILDADYTLLNGLPLIRLFGKTKEGETVCAFWDKFRPYFYVYSPKAENYMVILAELKKKWPELDGQIIDRRLPNGYSAAPAKVLKVIGKDPSRVPEQREAVQRLGAAAYEADILFKYRWMVDSKLRGMCWVDVKGNRARTETIKCQAIDATEIRPVDAMEIARHALGTGAISEIPRRDLETGVIPNSPPGSGPGAISENAPLRHLSIDIETISLGERTPMASKDPIIMISLALSQEWRGKKSLVLVARPVNWENAEGFSDEAAMLRRFLDILKDYDPDVIIGYNITNFDLPYIIERLEKLELPRDIGRTSKPAFIKSTGKDKISSVTGRVVVDPYEIIKRDPWFKLKRYDLRTVAAALLNAEKLEMGGVSEINKLWKSGNPADVHRLIEYSRRDSDLAIRLVLERSLLDRFIEIAKLSGILLQDTFGGQSQRLECRLLHEFRDSGFIMPCKPAEGELVRRREERERLGLKGAIVLEPIVGLHAGGCTLVLDFASLYPSVIRAFNICPTTLVRQKEAHAGVTDENLSKAPNGVYFMKSSIREGILPKIVREFVETRAAVKRAAQAERDQEKKRILTAKQLALKDMANSMYGYTGYIRSRLYVMDVASAITSYGRENILRTRELIENGFKDVKVIYGDTDSIFIKTDIADLEMASKCGEAISTHVTSRLPGLKFAFEKIFRTFLILTKKRYAGWAFEKTQDGSWKDKIEMKGIETVRRDWCELTSQTMKEILETILKKQDSKLAAIHVRAVVKDLQAGRVNLEKLTVVKGVTKSLESYDGVQPHVELAKRIRQRDPTRGSLVGERLGYVIIKGNTLLSKRAEEPQYVKEKNLEIDPQYYIENQVLPPLERIFEALGISKTELIEGSKQMKLNFVNGNGRQLSPDSTTLCGWESIACGKCSWSHYRPSLSGVCPECGGALYFQQGGSLGRFVKLQAEKK